MWLPVPDPILADFENVITVVFLVIGFLAWLINAIGGQKAKGPQRKPDWAQQRRQMQQPRAQRPGDRRLQSEIDVFLAEIKAKAQGQGGRQEPLEVVEILEPERRKPKGKKPAARAKQPPRPTKPGTDLAQRHLGSGQLGAGVRQRDVVRGEKDRMSAQVERDLAHGVEQSVSEHLGSFAATGSRVAGTLQTVPVGTEPAAPSLTPQGIVDLLRKPEGVLQAVLLSEILVRPRSVRRR